MPMNPPERAEGPLHVPVPLNGINMELYKSTLASIEQYSPAFALFIGMEQRSRTRSSIEQSLLPTPPAMFVTTSNLMVVVVAVN